jgi:hypothetical protein
VVRAAPAHPVFSAKVFYPEIDFTNERGVAQKETNWQYGVKDFIHHIDVKHRGGYFRGDWQS